MSSRIRGSSTRLKKRCAIAAFRLDVKMRVAWNMAAADHESGSVMYNTSSQFLRDGMILKAFGSFPARYVDMILPTALYTLTTLGSSSWLSSAAPAPPRIDICDAISVSFSLILPSTMSASVSRDGASGAMNMRSASSSPASTSSDSRNAVPSSAAPLRAISSSSSKSSTSPPMSNALAAAAAAGPAAALARRLSAASSSCCSAAIFNTLPALLSSRNSDSSAPLARALTRFR
mmetsp:Transcript_17412/g.45471  ORF Transcript_17412/g.45471 Transcript_17412/m.45471 type:complete len:233 (-) Transcript_17412:260-958(-)